MVRWTAGFVGVASVLAFVALVGFVAFSGTAREGVVAARWILCTGLVLTGVALLCGPRTLT